MEKVSMSKRWIKDWLVAPITWMFIIGTAIAVSVIVHKSFPHWPTYAAWICGLIVLILGVRSADWFWRAFNRILLGNEVSNPHRTSEQAAADRISRVLMEKRRT